MRTLSTSATYLWATWKSWCCCTGEALRLIGCGETEGNSDRAHSINEEEAKGQSNSSLLLLRRHLQRQWSKIFDSDHVTTGNGHRFWFGR